MRADSEKSAGVGGHLTSHLAGGASHLSPRMGTATSLLRMRANPHRTLCREEADQGQPATPAPASSRQPLGAERMGRAQAWTPGVWALPDAPASTHLLLCWLLMVGPPTAAHPRLAWPPAGLATSCARSPPSRHPHPALGSCRGWGSRRGHTRCPHVKHPEKDVGPRFKAHCQLCWWESDGPQTSLLTGVLQGVPRGRSGELDPQPGSRGRRPLGPPHHTWDHAPPPWTPPKGVWEGREDYYLPLQRACTPSSPGGRGGAQPLSRTLPPVLATWAVTHHR